MSRDWNILDDNADEPAPPPEDRLDSQRIRHIALERRAAYRRLFWARTLPFLFGTGTALCVIELVRSIVNPARLAQAAWFASAGLLFAVLTIRAAVRLRQFTSLAHPADATRPDPRAFDALSDGSQHARSLEEIGRPRD